MTAQIQIHAEAAGTLWKILAVPGAQLEAGTTIAIIECMKMEIPLETPGAGRVIEYLVQEGDPVNEEQVVAIFLTAS